MFTILINLLLIALVKSSWLEECGQSKYEDAGSEPRIVGGWETRPYEFPWQISMHRLRDSGEFTHSCGGSIINENWILTAAHCVDESEIDTLQIHVGAHNHSDPDENVLSIFNVMKIIVHEDYDPITVQNDIAVLQLDGTIEMNENIAGVCPANATIDYERQQALVSGWGALNFARDPDDRIVPDTLHAVQAPITPQSDCAQRYGALGFEITDDMICAGRINETEHDACQGDSGGPLVCLDQDSNRFEIVGVVSTGFGCADRAPGIYARVSYFLEWIDESITA